MWGMGGHAKSAQPVAEAHDEQNIARLSDELSSLGYWDDYQNRVALARSKYDVKKAMCLIVQGSVPDLEQGGDSPESADWRLGKLTGGPAPDDADADATSWRREFIVQKFSWQGVGLATGAVKRQESSGVCRLLLTRDGLQCSTSNAGCVWQCDWKSVSSFGVSKDNKTLSLKTGSKAKRTAGDMVVHSDEAEKLLDAVIGMAKRLAAEMKAEKSRAKEERLQQQRDAQAAANDAHRQAAAEFECSRAQAAATNAAAAAAAAAKPTAVAGARASSPPHELSVVRAAIRRHCHLLHPPPRHPPAWPVFEHRGQGGAPSREGFS